MSDATDALERALYRLKADETFKWMPPRDYGDHDLTLSVALLDPGQSKETLLVAAEKLRNDLGERGYTFADAPLFAGPAFWVGSPDDTTYSVRMQLRPPTE